MLLSRQHLGGRKYRDWLCDICVYYYGDALARPMYKGT